MNYNSSQNGTLNNHSVVNSVNGGSRAVQEANDRKARMVTFYKNGEPFSNGIRVSIIPGKDFKTLDQLCDYLTDRTKVPHGVRFIFSLNGHRIFTLNELEHGQCYVVSGVKQFQNHSYGQNDKSRLNNGLNSINSRSVNKPGLLREDDIRLLRPLSSRYKINLSNSFLPLKGLSYRDGRIITVVNNKDHNLRSRVLLNLRTPKGFETIVKDLGQSVRMKNAKRMFTPSGQEVRSVSQLKRDMINVELFYLDATPVNFRSLDIKSQSLESIANHHEDMNPNRSYNDISNLNNSLQYTFIRNSSRVDSAPDMKSPFVSDINPSRRGDSNTSEIISGDHIRQMYDDSDSANSFKSSETQTSPDFVKSARREVKKRMKQRMLEDNDQYNEVSHNSVKFANDPIERSVTKTKIRNDNSSAKSYISQSNSISNSDAIQEYAEILLKETALRVQNDNFKIADHSVDREVRKVQRISSLGKKKGSVEKKMIETIHEGKDDPTPNTSNHIQNEKRNQFSSPVNSNAESDNYRSKDEKIEVVQLTPVHLREMNTFSEMRHSKSPEKFKKDYFDTLRNGIDVPDKNLKLRWIHGYKGIQRNLFVLSNGELAFFVGSIGVLWNHETYSQRQYTKHTQDIQCMTVKINSDVIATAQNAGKKNPNAIIHVWSSTSLRTFCILNKSEIGYSITDISFSQEGFILVMNCTEQLSLTIWDAKKSVMLANAKKPLDKGEEIFGALFHPYEHDLVVTFGSKHLSLWQKRSDGTFDNRTAIKPKSKMLKIINCVEFLSDDSLLSGDASGTLTIWAPLENENGVLEFVIKEVRGHEKSIASLKLTANNILITGDDDGTIKTWDVSDGQFRLLNAIKLPSTTGSICSISMKNLQNNENDNIDIYIGTSMNLILRGSSMNATNYTVIFEGHSLSIRGLAADPKDNTFYTASLDQKICKWNDKSLIWKTTTQFQCVSASVHPNGLALATGSVNGTIFILNAHHGHIVSQLPVDHVCIGCLAFSPDGDLLAAGCQNGILHVLPVSENGFSYEKVSVLKGPFSILSLQWSIDGQYILTSVNDNNYQELILWDLPNVRYLRGAKSLENLIWKDATCSGGDDVRGIWDNSQMEDVVNLSCHCSPSRRFLVTGDEDGHVRLFTYPCIDSQAGFFEHTQGSSGVTEVKFLSEENYVVSSGYDGALYVWEMISVRDIQSSIQSASVNKNETE